MEKEIDSTKFKKHLLLSYIHHKGNCERFNDFIELISSTENECHDLIIELMKSGYIKYNNNGYEINYEKMQDYTYFNFTNNIFDNNLLNNSNKDATMYLPKSFSKK